MHLIMNLNKFPLLEELIIEYEFKKEIRTKNQNSLDDNFISLIVKAIKGWPKLIYFDIFPIYNKGRIVDLKIKVPINKYIRVEL